MLRWRACATVFVCLCCFGLTRCSSSVRSKDIVPDMVDGGPDTADGGLAGGSNLEGDGASSQLSQCAATGDSCSRPNECCSGQCDDGQCLGPEGPCELMGQPCVASSECCSGRCDIEGSGTCVTGGCLADGASCEIAADCCSLSCAGGQCAAEGLCEVEGGDCGADSDCCSNSCDGGTCQSTTARCSPLGEVCSSDSSCCSEHCEDLDGTRRCTLSSFCRAGGEVCNQGADCCSGLCGDDGLCPVIDECQTAGEPCTGFHECCSGICSDPGTGVSVCLFVSGCRPINEVCVANDDCCSGLCEEDLESGGLFRCSRTREPGCLHPGEVCWEGMSRNCCTSSGRGGGTEACIDTDIGINRCSSDEALDGCLDQGETCAMADDCCSGLCLRDKDGNYVCASQCVSLGGACTASGDCCDGLPCERGLCAPNSQDCLPFASDCEESEDCCSGFCDPAVRLCLSPLG